jgi:DNA-binding NarL/FixJ family response regulator
MWQSLSFYWGGGMNIIIVDGDESERLRLESLLAGQNGYEVVLSAGVAEAALIYLSRISADLVVIDLDLAGLSGALAIRAIKSVAPAVDIMVLTFADDDETVFSALKAGATGYILKDAGTLQVIAAIEEINAGGSAMSPSIARKVMREFQRQLFHEYPKEVVYALTRREGEILELLRQGKTLESIADMLCLSFHTIHTHSRNIYSKLNVNSRSQAVYKYFQIVR